MAELTEVPATKFRLAELERHAYMSDAGSGAHQDVKFFKPILRHSEYVVGIVAGGNISSNSHAFVICGAKPDTDIARPVKMEKIWTNEGGRSNKKRYQLWRPVPPEGFVALSDVPNFNTTTSNDVETWGESQIWCVAERFVDKVPRFIGDNVWTDKGTRSQQDGSIWRLKATDFMFGVAGYGTPQNPCYTVKKQFIPGAGRKFKAMVKDDAYYSKTCKTTDIHVPVGEIAEALVDTVGCFTTGGALAPLLTKRLKNAVLHVSWSTEQENETIRKHMSKDDVYVFFEMERSASETKSCCFSSETSVTATVKYCVVEAGNDEGRRWIQALVDKQAADALGYINQQQTWMNDGGQAGATIGL